MKLISRKVRPPNAALGSAAPHAVRPTCSAWGPDRRLAAWMPGAGTCASLFNSQHHVVERREGRPGAGVHLERCLLSRCSWHCEGVAVSADVNCGSEPGRAAQFPGRTAQRTQHFARGPAEPPGLRALRLSILCATPLLLESRHGWADRAHPEDLRAPLGWLAGCLPAPHGSSGARPVRLPDTASPRGSPTATAPARAPAAPQSPPTPEDWARARANLAKWRHAPPELWARVLLISAGTATPLVVVATALGVVWEAIWRGMRLIRMLAGRSTERTAGGCAGRAAGPLDGGVQRLHQVAAGGGRAGAGPRMLQAGAGNAAAAAAGMPEGNNQQVPKLVRRGRGGGQARPAVPHDLPGGCWGLQNSCAASSALQVVVAASSTQSKDELLAFGVNQALLSAETLDQLQRTIGQKPRSWGIALVGWGIAGSMPPAMLCCCCRWLGLAACWRGALPRPALICSPAAARNQQVCADRGSPCARLPHVRTGVRAGGRHGARAGGPAGV